MSGSLTEAGPETLHRITELEDALKIARAACVAHDTQLAAVEKERDAARAALIAADTGFWTIANGGTVNPDEWHAEVERAKGGPVPNRSTTK